jgi:hypothetical protein
MIIGTYTGPPPPYGGSASANEYSTIQELLNQLQDNTSNQIDAVNVRNSVYTLWKRYEYVLSVASQSASASVYYTNPNPTTQTIGGILAGSTFSEATMQEMWDSLLYPYVSFQGSLGPNITREYGGSNVANINWSVTKGSKNITTITFSNGESAIPDNTPVQSGTKTFNSALNTPTTFSMIVNDGTTTKTYNSYFNWTGCRYCGTLPIGHALTITSSAPFTHNDISSYITKKELNESWTQSQTITTNNDYVFFAFPHDDVDFSDNLLHVKIGGSGNNNWIKTRNDVQFTNVHGYTGLNYDVWIFGNTQAPNTFVYDIS